MWFFSFHLKIWQILEHFLAIFVILLKFFIDKMERTKISNKASDSIHTQFSKTFFLILDAIIILNYDLKFTTNSLNFIISAIISAINIQQILRYCNKWNLCPPGVICSNNQNIFSICLTQWRMVRYTKRTILWEESGMYYSTLFCVYIVHIVVIIRYIIVLCIERMRGATDLL